MSRREYLALFLAFLVSLPAVTTRLYASDEVEYFAWLRSVAFDGDVDFENEYQYFYDAGVARSDLFHETFLERTNEIGRRINYAAAGTALLWAPFYAAGHAVALATGAPADGFSQPYIAAVSYGSASYAWAAVVLSALIARRIVGRGLGAALVIAIGTPLVFYAYVAPGFAHATSAFAVSLFVWTWLRVRDQWSLRGAFELGLAGGLMAFVREQDLLLTLGPALDFLLRAAAAIRSSPSKPPWIHWVGRAAVGALAFLLTYAPQLAAYQALNGHPGPTETAARKMTWSSPHAVGVLFSPEHGLIAWTPLVVLALGGLVLLAAGRVRSSATPASAASPARVATLALVMVAAQVYTSGSVESWTVAGSFGQRRFVAITPLLTVGLAALSIATVRSGVRRALSLGVVLSVWWNLGLMAQFGMNRMDRQRLTLAENARATFFQLPFEAPSIAWRYLTDRSSFYGTRPD